MDRPYPPRRLPLPIWLFEPVEEDARWYEVIIWWERRRVPYNLFIAVWGVTGLTIYFGMLGLHDLMDWRDYRSSLGFFLTSPIMINLCYTLGWILAAPAAWLSAESKPWLSPLLLKLGMAFSALVIAAPAMLAVLGMILHNLFT
jgi:hypothetical protein